MAETRTDQYNFPQRGENQTNGEYLNDVMAYHYAHIGTPSIAGAMSWFFFCVFFFICWAICYVGGLILCFTIILCICGIGLFILGLCCFLLALICGLIGLVFLLVAVLNNSPRNAEEAKANQAQQGNQAQQQ